MPADEPIVPEAGDGGLVRVRLDLGYDGTDFSGWARQPDRRTVQGVLETALATVLRCPARLTVAGRTDAGVHATGQVAHVDIAQSSWVAESGRLLRRLAGVLPSDVRVYDARVAPAGFDARFAALARRYAYRLSTAPWGVLPLRRVDTLAWPRPMDLDALVAASVLLLGEHDFAAFCRRREGATTIRRLQRCDWAREEQVLTATLEADAFCHSMVRSLIGALLAVGEGRRPVDWPASLLSSTNRSSAVPVVPARGLTLLHVAYPADGALAARAELTRAVRVLPS